jgi:hypothetical protein
MLGTWMLGTWMIRSNFSGEAILEQTENNAKGGASGKAAMVAPGWYFQYMEQ